MKHIWTQIAASGACLIAGLFFAGATFAADATNSNTGADSNNQASVEISNNTNINSTNNAVINNTISVTANTGGNSASGNTGTGSISTGDISGSITVENSGNSNGIFNSVLNLNCSGTCNFTASNSSTGAGSTNNSSVELKNNVNLTIKNEANVNNNVGADLNTGGNSADKNTGDGLIHTGDINFSVSVKTDLNDNFVGGPVPEIPVTPTPPAVLPTVQEVSKVLAAAVGLPITGTNIPSWPLLLVAIGLALKLIEKITKKVTV